MLDKAIPDETILESPGRSPGRRILYLLPIILFVGIAIFLGIGLTLNPRDIPSPLIGKSVPEFELPPVKGRDLGLNTRDLKQEVSLVNVFASWCVACRQEHPLFMRLSRMGAVSIHGLNYKDAPDDAAAWLDELGDPYTRTGADVDGQVGIDWGVYGVPETFVVDQNGKIVYKKIGAVTQQDLDQTILPLVAALKKQGGQ